MGIRLGLKVSTPSVCLSSVVFGKRFRRRWLSHLRDCDEREVSHRSTGSLQDKSWEWCVAAWGRPRSGEPLPVGFACQLVSSWLLQVLCKYYTDISEHSDTAYGNIVRLNNISGSFCMQGVRTRTWRGGGKMPKNGFRKINHKDFK